jgi:hypothetical protein
MVAAGRQAGRGFVGGDGGCWYGGAAVGRARGGRTGEEIWW